MPTVDFERAVETTLESIDESEEIHPDNAAKIHEFKRDLKLEDMSDGWLQKLTSHLKIIAEHVGDTRFEDMTEEDVKDLVEWVHGRDVSESTVNAYKQVIKRFWRWLNDMPKGQHPEATAWINTTGPNKNGTLPKDLLTREDVTALLEACHNNRDRALIALLWETGARIGELIDLTVGDIEDNHHGNKVVIDGKTGPRRLPLVESTPHMSKWLNDHPNPRGDAPLWCKLTNGEEQVSYHYIRQKLLVRAGQRAAEQNPTELAENPEAVNDPEETVEFYKPLNPHHFRHSRATYMANEFTEAQLCEWFGWVQGSDVPARYVHLSGRDIDNAYSQFHGLEPEEEQEDEETVQECPRCQELNEPRAAFCMRCGFALDREAAESVEAETGTRVKESYQQTDPEDTDTMEKIDVLDQLLDDPEVKTALLERMDTGEE